MDPVFNLIMVADRIPIDLEAIKRRMVIIPFPLFPSIPISEQK